MTGASRQPMGEQERDNGLEGAARSRKDTSTTFWPMKRERNLSPLMGLQGILCPQGKARFPPELEGAGTGQRRVWIEGIFVRTEQYEDKDLTDEIDLGSLDILRSLE